MPARTGSSSCSTVRPILPSPSARSVPRCFSDWPIWLRTCVIRTFAILFRFRRFLFLVRQHLADRQAAHLRHLVGAAETLEAVDGRLRHVDRVRRAEALREDVADPSQLEHGADAAARDHAGSLARLAVADPDTIDLVADHHECGEREAASALDDLGDAVDLDDALLELAALLALDHRTLDARELRPGAQNVNPPSRAASASALTRPW